MKTLKGLIAFLFIFKGLLGYSQDLIIMKDGTKISCTIVRVSRSKIYYELYNRNDDNVYNGNDLYASIAKSKVEKFTYYNSVQIESKTSSQNNSNVCAEETENYSPKKGDTLVLTNEGVLFKGRVLYQNEILELMKNDSLAKREIEKSITYYDKLYKNRSNECNNSFSGFNFVIPTINFPHVKSDNVHPVVALVVIVSVGVAVVGTVFAVYGIKKLTYKVRYNKYHKYLNNAVSFFNAAHRVS